MSSGLDERTMRPINVPTKPPKASSTLMMMALCEALLGHVGTWPSSNFSRSFLTLVASRISHANSPSCAIADTLKINHASVRVFLNLLMSRFLCGPVFPTVIGESATSICFERRSIGGHVVLDAHHLENAHDILSLGRTDAVQTLSQHPAGVLPHAKAVQKTRDFHLRANVVWRVRAVKGRVTQWIEADFKQPRHHLPRKDLPHMQTEFRILRCAPRASPTNSEM